MKSKAIFPLVGAAFAAFCGAMVLPAAAADVSATLDVDVNKPGPAIAKTFYGLMTEEINHSYDGGLYAELIQNRSFQDPPPRARPGAEAQPRTLPVHWSLTGNGKASLDRENPVNAALPISLRLELSGGSAGVANDGY